MKLTQKATNIVLGVMATAGAATAPVEFNFDTGFTMDTAAAQACTNGVPVGGRCPPPPPREREPVPDRTPTPGTPGATQTVTVTPTTTSEAAAAASSTAGVNGSGNSSVRTGNTVVFGNAVGATQCGFSLGLGPANLALGTTRRGADNCIRVNTATVQAQTEGALRITNAQIAGQESLAERASAERVLSTLSTCGAERTSRENLATGLVGRFATQPIVYNDTCVTPAGVIGANVPTAANLNVAAPMATTSATFDEVSGARLVNDVWVCANGRPAKMEDMRVLNPQTNQFVVLSRPTCF